ncbi:MAG: hypothetical protein FJ207_09745 [Gemmatimonadetes bacterium]|nr:hypothetical protein [Gemmatimonadota bacterium]
MVNSGRELKNVITNEYIPLLDGRTLPIKFRPEQGFLGTIEVTPNQASVVETMTQQFAAVAYDLHGATLPATFTWGSGDTDVATVDEMGLATGLADGTVAISASAAGVTGGATLDVIGVARIEVAPIEATQAPGATQEFMAILYAADDSVLSGPTVTWASSDTDVATVDQDGLATAVADGVATISASAAGEVGLATLTVQGGIVAIGAGGSHSCALDATGRAYCWGQNGFGQLGDGTTTSRLTAVPVATDVRFAAISTGNEHTCALTADGHAYCWGDNRSGQLGDGTNIDRSMPTEITGTYTLIAASRSGLHTCALAPDGRAFCWGSNSFGGLGVGGGGNRNVPTAVLPPSGQPTPLSFADLSAGERHTCAVTTNGDAYCWGLNNSGQLGDATITTSFRPVPVMSLIDFDHVTAGFVHTCALSSGEAYCWGRGLNGQLGNNSPDQQSTPVPVATTEHFETLSAGGRNTCGLTPTGVAYCWGANNFGQAGVGAPGPKLMVPALVAGSTTFSSLSVGRNHACAVSTGGEAFCWWRNISGEVGNGTQVIQPMPDEVIFP